MKTRGEKIGSTKREHDIRTKWLDILLWGKFVPNADSLHAAAALGNLEKAQQLLAHGADVNEQAKYRVTPLWLAAQNGHLSVVELLLQHKARVNSCSRGNLTPYEIAIANKHHDIADVLIHAGARSEFESNFGEGFTLKLPNFLDMFDESTRSETKKSEEDFNFREVKPSTLLSAVVRNDIAEVKRLVACGTDLNESALNAMTPLGEAARSGNLEMVRLLVESGADCNYLGVFGLDQTFVLKQDLASKHPDTWLDKRFGSPPLWRAVTKGHIEVVRYLLSVGADPNATNLHDIPLLCGAAELGYVEIGKALIEAGAELSAEPLAFAVVANQITFTEMLLDRGVDVNEAVGEETPMTALLWAAEDGLSEMVKVLLDRGADIRYSSPHDFSCCKPSPFRRECQHEVFDIVDDIHFQQLGNALYLATPELNNFFFNQAREGQSTEEAFQVLLSAGADVNQPNDLGNTPLFLAAYLGSLHRVKALVDRGADVNAANKQGVTALHIAVLHQHYEVVDFLLSQGADIDAQNISAICPLEIAIRLEDDTLVMTLLKAGAAIDAVLGRLLALIQFKSPENTDITAPWFLDDVLTLFQEGRTFRGDINAQDDAGYTLLHKAAADGHSELVQALLKRGANSAMAALDGTTPAQAAARNKHHFVARILG